MLLFAIPSPKELKPSLGMFGIRRRTQFERMTGNQPARKHQPARAFGREFYEFSDSMAVCVVNCKPPSAGSGTHSMRASRERLLDAMAVGRVRSKPLSEHKFPLTGKSTGNSNRSGASRSPYGIHSKRFFVFRSAIEQGILRDVTGKCSSRTAIELHSHGRL